MKSVFHRVHRTFTIFLVVSVFVLLNLLHSPNAFADKLYFTNSVEGKIQRSELNGVNVEDVVTNLGTGDLIYIDIDPVEGKLYWSEAGIPGAIIRSNLDGSFPEVVLSNATSFITNPTIDPINKKVYWIQNIGEIKRANFDGSEAETVVAMPSPGPILSDIELDMNGKLYWLAFLDATTSIIERINLENMEREVITDDTVFPARALAVHRADSKVYWITDAIGVRNSIWRMNLDGSQREKVIDLRSTGSFERSGKLEIDSEAGRLYWAQHYTISRTELSGARLEIVHEEDPSTRPFFDMEIVKFTIPEQISDIFIGDVVSQQLVTAGGTAPYEWTIKEGALPSGLTLSADGLLEGIADKLGTFRFTLQAQDSLTQVAERRFTITTQNRFGPTIFPPFRQTNIKKAGSLAVPGRILEYWILAENKSGATLDDLEIAEFAFPPQDYTFKGANPQQDSGGDAIPINRWSIGSLESGESSVITYKAQLNPALSFTTPTAGPAIVGTVESNNQRMDTLWLNILKNDECWINTDVCTSKRSQCIANNCGLFNETNNPLCDECRDPVLFHRPFYIECGSGQCNACDQFPTGWAVSCQEATGPLDPNEKHVLADTYIQPDQPLVYPIHYENIGEVEAVDVFITDVLDPALDDSTLEFLVPEDASYDPATRQITWSLLDRNLQPGESDSVLFSIQPLPDLPSGTEIPNDAEIQFEVFDPLVTNTVLNVIDTDPPSCVVDRLPAEIPSTEFTLSWTGEDAVGEIKNYSIFVSVDNVDFEPFLLEVPGTTYVFEGEIGKSYGFFCVAIDTANNVELQELTAEATTTLIEDAELFEFNGFFWPVKSLPAQNTITAGRVVPMRWQLKNASGDFVQDLEAVKSVQYQADNCDGSVDEAGELVDAKSIGNLNVFFTRRTNTYTYLWKTPNNLKGECVDFVLTLGDERSYKARFKFRRQHRGPHFKD